MDSLNSLELLSTISEELELDLEMEDAMGLTTLQDAFEFVERNWAEQRQ
jgi:acyl carrier protein